MAFDNFLKKVQVDEVLICSLVKIIDDDLVFLRRIKLDRISSRRILTGHYDLLVMILYSIGLKNGYKIYSHEEFISLLLELNEIDVSKKFNNFKNLRNRLIYEGDNITTVEVRMIVSDVRILIIDLRRKYL